MVGTEKRHEPTRVLAPAGDSVLSTFTGYLSNWNCQKLAAEQPLRGQAVGKGCQ
jgi:hypothetical protein